MALGFEDAGAFRYLLSHTLQEVDAPKKGTVLSDLAQASALEHLSPIYIF